MSESPVGSLLGELEGEFQRRPFPVLELYPGEQYRSRLWGDRVERGQFYISQDSGIIFIGWYKDLERRDERNDLSKKKMNSTFCSTDILSKMFGLSYQEGEGYAGGDNILANPFPQEWETV